jgi:uncharacterized NAD(P)/FAD-binding protein YdhS
MALSYVADDPDGGYRKRIAIVGLGAAGALSAISLIREADSINVLDRIELDLYDPAGSHGRGLAYSTNIAGHILNMRASTMGFEPYGRASFVRWLQHTGSEYVDDEYPPRKMYGAYLSELLDTHLSLARENGARARIQAAEVTGYRYDGTGHLLDGEHGWHRYDAVVLCPGELPNLRYERLRASHQYVASPWHRPAVERIPADSVVAVLGASLSAVDAAVQLIDDGHRGPILFFTRTRYLPGVQPAPRDYPLRVLTQRGLAAATRDGASELELPELGRMLRAEIHQGLGASFDVAELTDPPTGSQLARLRRDLSRAEAGGIALYHVLDATSSIAPHIWRALSRRAKTEFLARYVSIWNMHRHCMPLVNGRKLLTFGERRHLDTHNGLVRVDWVPHTSSFRLETRYRGATKTTEADWVINATGSEHDVAGSGNSLLRRMLSDGHIAAHVHGGIDVDFDTCAVRGDRQYGIPSLFAVGPVTRGVHFYTNSIETTLNNARNMAKAAMASLVRSRTSALKGRTYESASNDHPRVRDVWWPEDAVGGSHRA